MVVATTLRESLTVALGDRALPTWPPASLQHVSLPAAILCVIIVLIVWEQSVYLYKRWKMGLDGPRFVVPFLGGILEMG